MDAMNREQFVKHLRKNAGHSYAVVPNRTYANGVRTALNNLANDLESGRITLAFASPASGDAPPSPEMRTACEAMLNVLVDALWQVDCDHHVCGKPNRCDHCDFKEAASTAIKQTERALASAATPEGCTAAERRLLEKALKLDVSFFMGIEHPIAFYIQAVRDERAAASARRGEGV